MNGAPAAGWIAERYEVQALAGAGGLAMVQRAHDHREGRTVALKMLLPQFASDGSLRARFVREGELGQRLAHANILPVLDRGEHEGVPFLVSPWAHHGDLRRLMDRHGGAFAMSTARDIAVCLAHALAYAHRAGVVHRDVKPQNVLLFGPVTADGSAPLEPSHIVLADFGLARVQNLASLTGSSLLFGTPEYMAPELLTRGRAEPRSDLFSLGVILFELLTGRLPWPRQAALERLLSLQTKPPTISTGHPDLDPLLASLLAPSPADRPPTAETVLAALAGGASLAVSTPKRRCGGCGHPHPEDLPFCPACGERRPVRGHTIGGGWTLILDDFNDDATNLETLHGLLDELAQQPQRRLKFLTGHPSQYAKHELKTGIKLPALLFVDLDEKTAHSLRDLFRSRGLKVSARRRKLWSLVFRDRKSRPLLLGAGVVLATGGYAAAMVGASFVSPMFVIAAALVAIAGAHSSRRLLKELPLFFLRPGAAERPAAEAVLSAARTAFASLQHAEVRALFEDLAVSLYRLTGRAEQMQAHGGADDGALALAREVLTRAPALVDGLARLAERLAAVDAGLDEQSEAEVARTVAAMRRRLQNARAEDRPPLMTAVAECERRLQQRQETESERQRLVAFACRMLAETQQLFQATAALQTPAERQAGLLAEAERELQRLLSAMPPTAGPRSG